ncbi:hypothetical protein [Methylobacterium sp. Leaf123]|uniref:hypothetical protein n=1 Tax=Methylobacterium sp. Leaf123 TaxID=1736264 RepID=UPI000ADAB4EF|nr:hypothetical protein [Methylobacterium sp. Leaf123]
MSEAIHRERQRQDLSTEAARLAPEGPSLSFDAARGRFLIAKALFTGAKDIAADRHGQKHEA